MYIYSYSLCVYPDDSDGISYESVISSTKRDPKRGCIVTLINNNKNNNNKNNDNNMPCSYNITYMIIYCTCGRIIS